MNVTVLIVVLLILSLGMLYSEYRADKARKK